MKRFCPLVVALEFFPERGQNLYTNTLCVLSPALNLTTVLGGEQYQNSWTTARKVLNGDWWQLAESDKPATNRRLIATNRPEFVTHLRLGLRTLKILREGVPRKHLEDSLVYMYFPSFSHWKQAFWYTPNLYFACWGTWVFTTFQSCKTPLVYTLFPSKFSKTKE